jgi:NADH-quinone oxidoreductase subunit H
MDGIDLLIVVLVTVGAFALWLVGTALTIWAERRIVARMQSRPGPNRLGPFGILQTLADGAKLFFKEDITPSGIDRLTYFAAPAASAIVAIMTFAVVPYGGTFTVGERTVTLQVWDPDIGLLWILAMSSIGVYGIVLGGWSSGSKYPLLGGVRSSAQMVSYELAMGLGLAAVFVYTGSLRASDVVANQAVPLLTLGPLSIPAWHIVPMAPAFVLFFLSAVAETQRPPFDLPEAEGELVAGFHTEYSGAKFAMFFLAEFMNMLTMSAVTVTLFFGGPSGPLFGPGWLQAILPTGYFVAKVAVFVFIFVWLRGTLPRLRYDRLMDLGWKVLLPLGLVWVLATGFSVVLRQSADQGTVLRLAGIGVALAIVLYLVAPLFSRPDPVDGDGDGGGGSARTEPEPPGDGSAALDHPTPPADESQADGLADEEEVTVL